MTVTVRSLPTAYDPPDDAVSVATPTCCCCCCCCLATVTAASMFVGAEAYYRATEQPETHGRRRRLFAFGFLSVLALPLLAVYVLSFVVPDVAGIGLLLSPILCWAVLVRSGAPAGRAVLVLLATVAVALPVFVVELALALPTVFLIELTFPLTMWAAWAIARRRHRARLTPVALPAPPWPTPP